MWGVGEVWGRYGKCGIVLGKEKKVVERSVGGGRGVFRHARRGVGKCAWVWEG